MEYDSLLLRSELALATHGRLGEAGITIPFPQRDLHLASVSPEVSAVLAGKEGAEPGRARSWMLCSLSDGRGIRYLHLTNAHNDPDQGNGDLYVL
jgi:hypothetical protein